MISDYLIVALISLLPWVELRGAIPFGILCLHLAPLPTMLVATFSNLLVFPLLYGLLLLLYPHLGKWGPFRSSLSYAASRVHKRGPSFWRGLSLFLFVAVPLPFTGAWTATFLAWFLKMDRFASFVSISLGLLVAALLVTLLSLSSVWLLSYIGVGIC